MRIGRISLPDYLTPLFKTPYSEVFKIRIPDNDVAVAEIKYADRAKFPIIEQDDNSNADTKIFSPPVRLQGREVLLSQQDIEPDRVLALLK